MVAQILYRFEALSRSMSSQNILEGSGAAPTGPGAANDSRQAQILYQTNGNKRLVCQIKAEFPVFNPKATTFKITVFTSLQLKQYRQLYLVATSYTPYSDTFTAPAGAIVLLTYSTGSWKHVTNKYTQFFVVAETGVAKHVLRDLKGSKDVEAEVQNLIPINSLSSKQLAEVEVEIINRFGARLSEYDPVRTLYYIWIKGVNSK